MKINTGTGTPVYPAPDLIVGTYDKNDRPNAMAVAWGGVCSSEPPCIAISVRKNRYSYHAIEFRKAFTVNIPSERFFREADLFGMISGEDCDKFSVTSLTPVKGAFVDAPLIDEFPISMECELIKTVEIGSHIQFIGQVMACWVDESCMDSHGRPDPAKVKPIMLMPQYGVYYGVGTKIGQAYRSGRELLKDIREGIE